MSRSFPILIVLCFNLVALVRAQMMADITSDVETAFGIYHPYWVDVTPDVAPYTVEPDFSNVDYFSAFGGQFNSTDSTLLRLNHFTVKRSRYQQLYDIYNLCTWYGVPVFVTTDAVLHTYHVLFDRLLAEIEVQRFMAKAELLTESLLDGTQSVFDQAVQPTVREAARRNLAFLGVAKKLLEGDTVSVPEPVSALVDSEQVLIFDHDGFHYSPIFGEFSQLDYSQFQPRGHYTRTESLQAYFRAMMWYGWTIFTMEPELFGDLSRRHTLQALMLVQLLYNLEAGDEPLRDIWDAMYETTVFFVGKTDDPNIMDYKAIADQVYGADFLSLSPDSLATTDLLDTFMSEAQKLPEPKIPNWIWGTFITYKGFRLMGQRFIPDSHMFAHLIYPYVGSAEQQRWMPKGLDIMAILGSERAYTLLDSVYNETGYLNYAEKIQEFRLEYSTRPAEDWAQNLYWNWLYCLMPLLFQKGEGYPVFMQAPAWADKELMTALASWAELRHDTILYAKQSMTPCGIGPAAPRSYVEPNPFLYARLASLARYTREGLQSRGLLLLDFQDRLDLFEKLLLFLTEISIKELEDVPLSTDDYENIFCFGRIMEELVTAIPNPQEPWDTDTDDMAVIADVHTDSNLNECLEEGVGYPLEISVIVNEGGNMRITQGAIFSYYEFKQPISARLTDEAWREMLIADTAPDMPEWVASFMDAGEAQPTFYPESPDNLYFKDFLGSDGPAVDPIPETWFLEQNYPNPFNPYTVIGFSLPEASHMTLVVTDILGREVVRLVDNYSEAGTYRVIWDGRSATGRAVPSGIYIARLITPEYTRSIKMVLLK